MRKYKVAGVPKRKTKSRPKVAGPVGVRVPRRRAARPEEGLPGLLEMYRGVTGVVGPSQYVIPRLMGDVRHNLEAIGIRPGSDPEWERVRSGMSREELLEHLDVIEPMIQAIRDHINRATYSASHPEEGAEVRHRIGGYLKRVTDYMDRLRKYGRP